MTIINILSLWEKGMCETLKFIDKFIIFHEKVSYIESGKYELKICLVFNNIRSAAFKFYKLNLNISKSLRI